MTDFVPVCDESALSGNRALVQVPPGRDGRYVAVIRHKGALHAIDATCYHMGGPLLTAEIEEVEGFGSCVVCPWHRYQITLKEGAKVYMGIDGKHTTNGKCKQRIHDVKIHDSKVWVKLNLDGKIESDTYGHKKPAPAQGSTGPRSGHIIGNGVNRMISNSMRGGDGAAPWMASSSSSSSPSAALPPRKPSVLLPMFQPFVVKDKKVLAPNLFTLKISLTGALYAFSTLQAKHLEVSIDGTQRYYTPYITPGCDRDEIILFVKIYPGGVVSPKLAEILPGGTIDLRGPLGGCRKDFVQNMVAKKLIMVAGGTGVAPMLQILHALLRKNPEAHNIRDVEILMCLRSDREISVTSETRAAELSNETVTTTITHLVSEPSPAWEGLKGKITSEFVTKNFPPSDAPGETKFLFCGPERFNVAVEAMATAAGHRDDDIQGFE